MNDATFTRWQDAGYPAHDTLCGTGHDGHCPLDCDCWCHYGPVIVVR